MSTQTPREIAFEDIRAGDRIRTEHPAGGVKFMREGVAHQNTHDGWFTREGGLLIASANIDATITLLRRPVPAEPMGLGAVVRATVRDGLRGVFVRACPEGYSFPWHAPGDGWMWSAFDPDSIEVLSEGIEVES